MAWKLNRKVIILFFLYKKIYKISIEKVDLNIIMLKKYFPYLLRK
jgi:hypothetical protein